MNHMFLNFWFFFVLMLTAFYPLDRNKFILSICTPIIILLFFTLLRQYNDELVDTENLITKKIYNSIDSIKLQFNRLSVDVDNVDTNDNTDTNDNADDLCN